MRRRALLAAAVLAPAARAQPVPPSEVVAELPGARLLGQARLRFLGLHVYDIRLWAAAASVLPQPAQLPLALEIEYARALVGKLIAERSLKEMQGVAEFTAAQGQRWLERMIELFPDVKAGERITGVQRPGEGARFFHDGRALGDVREAEFAQAFFGIWLSPRTSEPRMREQLLGSGGSRP